jgi:hypothetical protein
MRKLKIFSGIYLIAITALLSCEKTDMTYTGPPVAEFAPRSASATYTSAFSTSVKQTLWVANIDTLELTVNLVGHQSDKDLVLEYSLVTERVNDFPSATYYIDPTTAIEGTHFNFVPARNGTANGTLTIPANSSSGVIRINTIASQASPDVSKRVVVQLLPTSDLSVNPNYQYFIVTIARL